MSKLSVALPPELDRKLDRYIPWGSKGAIITEVLWQLADQAEKDGGQCIYETIKASTEREKRNAAS